MIRFAAVPTQSYMDFLIKWGYDRDQAEVSIMRLQMAEAVCINQFFFREFATAWIKELALLDDEIFADQVTFPATRKHPKFSIHQVETFDINSVNFLTYRLPALRDIQILTSDMKQKQAESIMLYIVDVVKRKKSKKVGASNNRCNGFLNPQCVLRPINALFHSLTSDHVAFINYSITLYSKGSTRRHQEEARGGVWKGLELLHDRR